MFRKTMKFDDLNGDPVEHTFYFNYNKKEVAELLEFGYISQFPPADGAEREPLEVQLTKLTTPTEESGLSEYQNVRQAYEIFQDLVLNAYGEKGADNVTFVKNARTREYFQSHVAYVEMIFEFIADTKLATDFIEACLPAKMVAAAKEEMQKENAGKLSSDTLHEMVAEAARRQEDPATRIEPGMQAAVDAGVAPPEMLKEQTKPYSEYTERDFADITDPAVLDQIVKSKQLDQAQLMLAFVRRGQLL